MLNISGSGAPASTHVTLATGVAIEPIRLILVDDDADFREAASAELENLGFSVTSFPDGQALLASLANGTAADAIVLDWVMPDMTGADLLRRLRDGGIKLPAVFLTGRSTPTLESEALDQGALDFVDKTRGLPILAKRVRKIFHVSTRPAAEADEMYRRGPLLLNGKTNRCFWNGTDIGLTLTEFRVVHLLATSGSNFVTYRAVYDCVHREGFVAGYGENGYRGNVRSMIKRIRSKFRAVDPAFRQIENYASFGYRWECRPNA